MNVIEIKDLTRDYGSGRGIFDVNFSVRRGECFGFLGPNGAGKTTTLRHLMGFINPRSGICTVNGMDCRKDSAKIQSFLGYIPGETAFIDSMSGMEFIKFLSAYRGMHDLGKAPELIRRFDLDPHGKIRKMSKGMKQKIAIVCAFMHDPEVLILDEPTSGLDPLMQNRFIDLIAEEKNRGKTILMSSHMFEEVERTCGRVGIIRSGHLVAVDEISALKESQLKRYVVTFDNEKSAGRFASEGLMTDPPDGCRISVTVRNDLTGFLQLLAKYPVKDLSQINQSLEEIFLQYYGEETPQNISVGTPEKAGKGGMEQ